MMPTKYKDIVNKNVVKELRAEGKTFTFTQRQVIKIERSQNWENKYLERWTGFQKTLWPIMVMFIIRTFLFCRLTAINIPHGILETTSLLGILDRRIINDVNIKIWMYYVSVPNKVTSFTWLDILFVYTTNDIKHTPYFHGTTLILVTAITHTHTLNTAQPFHVITTEHLRSTLALAAQLCPSPREMQNRLKSRLPVIYQALARRVSDFGPYFALPLYGYIANIAQLLFSAMADVNNGALGSFSCL